MDDAEEGLAMAHDTEHTPAGPAADELCCYCQHAITGQADRVIGGDSSMSGAKPDLYAHPACGPRTRSITHGRRR